MMKQADQAAREEIGPADAAGRDEHIAPAPRVSVQAFCENVDTAAAIQAAGEDRRLAKAHLRIQMGGMTAATEAYQSSPTPNVIILESDNRSEDVLAGLDALAHYCDAGNRPRMVARNSQDGKTVEFDFLDVAGNTQYGHMQHVVFTLIDANHHTEDWTFMMPGDKPMHGHMDLQRTK